MNKFVSFLLVIFPILNIYAIPGFSSCSIASLIVILTYIYIIANKQKINYSLCSGFKLFWLYCALIYIVFAHTFSIGLFIPGGVSFVFWVLLFWLGSNFLNFELFKKYYRIVFICCAIAFLFQEILYYKSGSRPLFMLPLPFYAVDRAEIILNQIQLNRSSCFFIEPSHFAQFAIPLLAIELFAKKTDNILNLFSAFLIFVLLLLQSGNGILGLIVLLSIKFFVFCFVDKSKKKMVTCLIFILLIVWCIYQYIGTTIGQGIMERALNLGFSEDSEGSTRTIKGFILFNELPFINKIFGYHIDDIAHFAIFSKIGFIFYSQKTQDYSVYLNGIQHVLVITGIIGLFLFLNIWAKLYKHNGILSKSLIGVFLVLMFVGNLYLSHMMLLCMLLPYLVKTKRLQV